MIFRPRKDAGPLYKAMQLLFVLLLLLGAWLIAERQLEKHFEKPIAPVEGK